MEKREKLCKSWSKSSSSGQPNEAVFSFFAITVRNNSILYTEKSILNTIFKENCLFQQSDSVRCHIFLYVSHCLFLSRLVKCSHSAPQNAKTEITYVGSWFLLQLKSTCVSPCRSIEASQNVVLATRNMKNFAFSRIVTRGGILGVKYNSDKKF